MGIKFSEKNKIFTITTKKTTYQFQVDGFGFLLHLYYGARIEGEMDYLLTFYDRGFSGNPHDAGADRTYSMDVLPQEFPCMGNGDYRSSALIVQNMDGTYSCDLRYQGYEIQEGKYGLKGLPAVYASSEEAQTLVIHMEDPVTKVRADLLYGVLPEYDIITRSVKIQNQGNEKIYLEKAASACLDFLWGDYDLISFYGRHTMERNFQRTPVEHGMQLMGSRRGTSSHQYNPFMILCDRKTTETTGSCYGMLFVYSGGFRMEAEKDQFNQTRAIMGLQSEKFRYPLMPGEEFIVPETVLTYSAGGFEQLSHNLHKCIRTHVCRGKYRDLVRPVLVNSWEAAYFDFDGEKILELAKNAADLGMEMVVLDDGWFGKRDSDNSGLGDWTVNEKKLGCSMGELAAKVNQMGLKFGLWVEPEMVSEDSQLYKEHPDWAIRIPGRPGNIGRSQLVLDFSRKEVRDSVFDQICEVLDHANIEYVKWDMNRSISDVYSMRTTDQGRVLYDYVLGIYEFLEKMIDRYPDLLIEGCSGGGGRFDAGMLYYTPQIWCSDNTDAIDRTRIQYGTSFAYPVSTVGSHISAVPNHQTGRVVPLHTRNVVAMAGTFGYELDLQVLNENAKQKIRSQIQNYHKYAELIQKGEYYRLSDPFCDEIAAWAFVSEDQKEVLLNVVMLETHGNMPVNYVRLRGLCSDMIYENEQTGKRYSGGALMEAGIPMPVESGEYLAYQIYLRAVEA